MTTLRGRVVGEVSYREGDGVEMRIPRGPCEIVRTVLDATLTWSDGATHGSTAIPLADLARHVKSGALVIDDEPEDAQPPAVDRSDE